MERNKGITLIALVITIIILLILAGIALTLVIGDNGILNKTKIATEEYKKVEVKEAIELAIADIQAEKISKNEPFNHEILADQLQEKLADILAVSGGNEIQGEYKQYQYIITEEFEVIIGEKAVGANIQMVYTIENETIGVNTTNIQVVATIRDSTIIAIIKPDGNQENADNVTYAVSENGEYKFTAIADNGKKASMTVKVQNIKPVQPHIERLGSCPIIKATGIEMPTGETTVKITYDDSQELNHYYSTDGGNSWILYTGEFTLPENVTTIKAKSEFKNNTSIYTESEEKKQVIMTANVFDKDDSTGMPGFAYNYEDVVSYIEVDPSAIGKKIRLYWQATSGSYCYSNIRAYNNKTKQWETLINSATNYNNTVVIPENVTKLQYWGQINTILYEIQLVED